MPFKPVKSLSVRSSIGQRHARELDRIDVPFLRRNNGDGSTSYKKGSTLMERSTQPDEPLLDDGFYCLGKVGAEYRVMGSLTARGSFKDRGSAGAGTFAAPSLAFYGGGLGADIDSEHVGVGFPNFDGKVYPLSYITISTTRDGRRFTPRFTVVSASLGGDGPPYLQSSPSSPLYEWFGTVRVGDRHEPRIYYVCTQVIDGEHMPKVFADPTRKYGEVVSLPTLYIPGQLCIDPSIELPNLHGGILMLNRFVRPTYRDSSVNVSACPGVVFTASSDHGASWQEVPTDGMFSDAQSLMSLPVDANHLYSKYWAWKFNDAVEAANLALFPTDPASSRGIAIGLVPVALFIGVSWTVRFRRKIGRYDGFSITESITLGEDADPDAAAALVSSGATAPLVLNGVQGIIYLNRYNADLDQIPATRPTLMWTDGYTTTTLGVTPFRNAFTGSFTGIGPGKIVCPMYDGEYSLYELTSDMTWTKRATIAPATEPPDPDYWAMPNFSRLTYLRKDGRPVSATPSAPWMTNSRISPPT